jgi:hypothetical protein
MIAQAPVDMALFNNALMLAAKRGDPTEHSGWRKGKVAEMLVRERTVNQETFRKRLLSEIPAEAEGKRAPVIAVLLQEAFDEFLDDIQKSIPRIVSRHRLKNG